MKLAKLKKPLLALFLLFGLGFFVLGHGSSLSDAHKGQTKAALGQVKLALSNYHEDCGHYPEKLQFLMENDSTCKNWGPKPYFLRAIPKDGWNHDFIYENHGKTYLLKSLGDGKGGKEITAE